MDEIYKLRRIHTFPRLSPDAACWIPQADISWDEQGSRCHQRLTGPPDRFTIIDQAEAYALEMAIAWIDAQFTEDLTP